MARRIVSARDQVEMLSPWREAAQAGDRPEFRWERGFDGGGGWVLITRNPDGNPVQVITEPARGQRTHGHYSSAASIPYQRNNNGMRGIPGYGQDLEPWGRYMMPDAPRDLPEGWERGTVDFNNPLHVDHEGGGWKQTLSDQYGATGQQLSEKLLADGYDGVVTHDKYGIGEIVDVRPKEQRGHRTSSRPSGLSDEDLVSVAENVMERAGHGGRTFNIPTATFATAKEHGVYDEYGSPDPRTFQRQHSQGAEDYVNDILADRGWEHAGPRHRVRVEPEHWDLRQPGSGQAVTDGYNYIGLKGNDTNALALLHETAHILTRTPHGPGGHGPEFQQAVHGLYRDHIHPDAADIFAGIVWPDQRTAKLLYHRTTPENAASINQSRRFHPGLEKGQRGHRLAGMVDSSDGYRGVHRSPGPGTMPVHDMAQGVPEDWYTHPQYYTSGEVSPGSQKATQALYNSIKGNPDHPVTIYRALPSGHQHFNTGDWVTPSLEYAQQHAIQDDDPANDWPIISTTVPAKHLWQDGNSYYEMGYHGPRTPGEFS